jgi:hypothetical protein
MAQNCCPEYGPQWRKAIDKELAGFDSTHCYETVKLEKHMLSLHELSLKPI